MIDYGGAALSVSKDRATWPEVIYTCGPDVRRLYNEGKLFRKWCDKYAGSFLSAKNT